MGSISSRPKAPNIPQPQIVYVPAPQPAASPVPPTSPPSAPDPQASSGETGKDTEKSQAKAASGARAQNLLKRERSRFGTVLTGFRGLLGKAKTSSQRKTLLGE